MASAASIFAFFVLSAGMVSAARGRDEPLPSAESVLDRVEARAGDKQARTDLKSLLATGKMEVPGMPGPAVLELASIGRDRTKLTITMRGMGEMTQGTAGDVSWSTDPAMGVTVRVGDERLAADRLFRIARREPWRDVYERAETVGRTDVGGRPCLELKLTTKSGQSDRWFVDAETADLARVDLELPDPTGGALPMTWLYGDYREVGGVRIAHRRTQQVAGMELVFQFDEFTANSDVPADKVDPSAEVKAAIDDPGKRTPLPPQQEGACTVEVVTRQPVLSIRMKIKADEVSKNLAVMLPEIFNYIAEIGATPVGPPFSRYHALSETEIDIEAGMPVAAGAKGKDRIQASELPGGRVAVTWHTGPYHGLPKTYAALETWMRAEQLEARGPFWEVYWTDPGIEPDPKKWKTRILWPVE